MSEMEQKPAAQRDADMIAATLAEMDTPEKPAALPPKPVPKPVRVKRQPEPVIATAPEDDDWDSLPDAGDDDAPASVGARVGTSKAATAPTQSPAPVPIVPAIPTEIVYGPTGFPDWSKDADYIRANENVTRLESQLREATAKAQESCDVLGLKMGQFKPGRVEEIAEKLIVEDKPLDDVEAFESRCKHVRRLEGALDRAKKAVHPAREVAVRKLYQAAQEVLKPTFREMMIARVAYLKTVLRHRDMLTLQRGAGYPPGNDWSSIVTTVPIYGDDIRSQFGPLVASGVLTHDEVAGLPGF